MVGGRDEIFIEVGASSPKSWYQAQKVLADLPVVTALSVHSLTAQKGVLKLQLSGPVEALQMAIRASGYRLDVSDTVYRCALILIKCETTLCTNSLISFLIPKL